jgi:hypothetical protein
MAEFDLKINDQERTELLRLLTSSLGETRVEVHRTHSPDYRETVKHEEEVIRHLLEKIEGLSGKPARPSRAR